MKFLIVLLSAVIGLSHAAGDSCYTDVQKSCRSESNDISLRTCTSQYGGFNASHPHALQLKLSAYANRNLDLSYQYLLQSAFFDNFENNRKGFSKLFRKLSDDTWEKTLDLIKHITMRGGVMDFYQRDNTERAQPERDYNVDIHELASLSKALDIEKSMAENVFDIHRLATRNTHDMHDAEVSEYLEDEFIEKQAGLIRNLAGYTNDIKGFVSDNQGQDLSLALYLYDEYLHKTV